MSAIAHGPITGGRTYVYLIAAVAAISGFLFGFDTAGDQRRSRFPEAPVSFVGVRDRSRRR